MNETTTERVTRKGRRRQLLAGTTGEADNASPTMESGAAVPGAYHDPNRPYALIELEMIANNRAQQQMDERRQREQEQREADTVWVMESRVVPPPEQPRQGSSQQLSIRSMETGTRQGNLHSSMRSTEMWSRQGSLNSSLQSMGMGSRQGSLMRSMEMGRVISESSMNQNPEQSRHDSEDVFHPEEWVEPEREREQRKTWVYTTNIFIIFIIALVLVIVLPIQLQKKTGGEGPVPTRHPTVQEETPRPTLANTPAPSLSPRGAPFVKSGPELAGENEGARLGSAVVVVGDRWLAYGSQGHGVNQSGLVRVVDMHNGTQIGQDIVGNSTEGFTEVGWSLASAEGGWLAVAGRHTVRLLRYNLSTALWEQYGGVLSSTDIQASSFFSTWFVRFVSINPFVMGNNTIALVVTTYRSAQLSTASEIHTFAIDVDHPSPAWRRLASDKLILDDVIAHASLMPGKHLMVWIDPNTNTGGLYILAYSLWGSKELILSRIFSAVAPIYIVTAVAHNSSSSTVAYLANNLIWVQEIDDNLNLTGKGLPIVSTGGRFGSLAFYKDWLVHAKRTVVRVFRYDDLNGWTRQGEDIEVEDSRVLTALGGDPGSPMVAVGLPETSVVRYESVYLNSTNLTSFTNPTNLFTRETGHVFENRSVVWENGGALQLYDREI